MKKNESPIWYFRTIERQITKTNAKVIFDLNSQSDKFDERFCTCEIKNSFFDKETFAKLNNVSQDLLEAISLIYDKKANLK
ncbi:type II toxin-antitoxin system RnlB family antitoxin [Spiroplasma endosymbiont of Panorpa germanica]|uniref:type II toxin-antitoxin system RnlB family antitoxin n=1 Tax=Spiroplasma endosymbiont of Panorpa germanica TaxID=3066314 RepID=UPI0030CDE01C